MTIQASLRTHYQHVDGDRRHIHKQLDALEASFNRFQEHDEVREWAVSGHASLVCSARSGQSCLTRGSVTFESGEQQQRTHRRSRRADAWGSAVAGALFGLAVIGGVLALDSREQEPASPQSGTVVSAVISNGSGY